jgi:hypothetical protein
MGQKVTLILLFLTHDSRTEIFRAIVSLLTIVVGVACLNRAVTVQVNVRSELYLE